MASSTWSSTHNDADGNPVPSRFATPPHLERTPFGAVRPGSRTFIEQLQDGARRQPIFERVRILMQRADTPQPFHELLRGVDVLGEQ